MQSYHPVEPPFLMASLPALAWEEDTRDGTRGCDHGECMEKKERGLPEEHCCEIPPSTLVAVHLWEVDCVVVCRPSVQSCVGSFSALTAFIAFLTKGRRNRQLHWLFSPSL